jgi:hypothetical protein
MPSDELMSIAYCGLEIPPIPRYFLLKSNTNPAFPVFTS